MALPSRPLILGGLALALVALAGLATMLLGDDGQDPPLPQLAPPASAARPPSATGAGGEPDAVAPPLTTPAAGPEPVVLASEPRREAPLTPYEAELAEARWIAGRVVFPESTPADEQVTITARGKRFAHGPLHSAVVSADGRFRVAFSKATKRAQLALEGRYLYLESLHAVDLEDRAGETLVEPLLGGRIHGSLVLPPGTSAEDAANLSGATVQLAGFEQVGANTWASTVSRRVTVAADLTFVLDAIPCGVRCDVECDPGPFVPALLEGVAVAAGAQTEIELRFRLGARVRGRVVRPDGSPVAEVSVGVSQDGYPQPWGADRLAKTDEHGTFDLRGIQPGEIFLSATEPETAPAAWGPEELADGEVREGVTLVLGAGSLIAGHVRYPDGAAPERAIVEITRIPKAETDEDDEAHGFIDPFEPPLTARADRDGRFEVAGLEPGPYTLRARATRTEPASSAGEKRKRSRWSAELVVDAGARDLVVTLSTGEAVAGRVVDDRGAPVPRFSVSASRVEHVFSYGPDVSTSVRDSADGSFRLEGLDPGEWEITAEADGNASRSARVQVPGAEPVTLTLPRTATVAGTVVDGSGTAIAGARVFAEALEADHAVSVFGPKANVETDASGAFRLTRVPSGAVQILATARGLAPGRVKVALAPNETRDGLCIVLSSVGSITGEVRTERGPGANLTVDVYGRDNDTSEETTTDPQGRFRFDHLGPGEYHLSVEDADAPAEGESWRPPDEELQATVVVAEGSTVHVVLGGAQEPRVRLFGRCSVDREPAAGAHLFVVSRGPDYRQPVQGECDADGSYELALGGPGVYAVHVSTEDGANRRLQVSVPDVSRHRLDIAFDTGAIGGRVTGPAGEPLGGIRVLAIEGSEWSQDAMSRGTASGGVTDAGGRFSISRLATGTWTVGAGGGFPRWPDEWDESGESDPSVETPYGCNVAHVTLTAGATADVSLELPLAGTLAGRVVDRAGAPIVEAEVYARGPDGRLLGGAEAVETSADGTYRFAGLPPGRITVLARKEYSASRGEHAVDVRSGDEGRADLVLEPATLVLVRTVDSAGAKLDAPIQVLGVGGRFPSGSAAFSDAAGQRVGPLPPGSYTIRATDAAGRSGEVQVSVAGEPEQRVELVLKN